jgi:protein-disulfide isomerase
MRRLISVVMSVMFACSLALPAIANGFSATQKLEMEQMFRDYLMAHPEILRDMANKLDENDKKKEADARVTTLKNNAPEIFHHAGDAVVGNPKGDVTVVEFFDYNCGWCKKSVVEMQSLIAKDKNVRVVMKEFPIFGEGSEYAARAALASIKQGKYWAFHQALFASESKVTVEVVDQVAGEQGLDVALMKKDMADPKIAETLKKNQDLAQSMLLTGTPGFIIDDQVFPGYTALDGLQASLATVRKAGGCKLC